MIQVALRYTYLYMIYLWVANIKFYTFLLTITIIIYLTAFTQDARTDYIHLLPDDIII